MQAALIRSGNCVRLLQRFRQFLNDGSRIVRAAYGGADRDPAATDLDESGDVSRVDVLLQKVVPVQRRRGKVVFRQPRR